MGMSRKKRQAAKAQELYEAAAPFMGPLSSFRERAARAYAVDPQIWEVLCYYHFSAMRVLMGSLDALAWMQAYKAEFLASVSTDRTV